jgi:hypothetical protein
MAEPIQMTPDESGSLTHRQIMLVLSGLLLGMLLAALDQTIVPTAMRTIADHLHGQTNQPWATTAYLVTATVSTPLYGKLSDSDGRSSTCSRSRSSWSDRHCPACQPRCWNWLASVPFRASAPAA